MPIIKISNIQSISSTINATSSNVSSSVSGNINLIQEQLNQKTNQYINIKNAVNILEKYSNWNGYIKLYTEVENNFNVNDIVYITYTEPFTGTTQIYSLDNFYSNITKKYYTNPFDDNIKQFSFGYRVLFVNKQKNEIVINRYYNDITSEFILKNQALSKVSCRGGNYFGDNFDGVVHYNCNIFSGTFGIIQGYISGSTLSGATVLNNGVIRYSNSNGFYSLNVPAGINIIKFYYDGYITKTVNYNISTNTINYLDVTLIAGENSVTITSDVNAICSGSTVTFNTSTIGYDEPVNYQWTLTNIISGKTNVGTDSNIFIYDSFMNGDIVKCEIRDDLDIINNTYTESNEIMITIVPRSVTIVSNPVFPVYQGDVVQFFATIFCDVLSIFQWKINGNIITGNTSSLFTTNSLINGDIITCEVDNLISNQIIAIILEPTTTMMPTTSTMPTTTTMPTTSGEPDLPPFFFELFGQLFST